MPMYRVYHIETGNRVADIRNTAEEQCWEEIAEGSDVTVEEAKTIYRLEDYNVLLGDPSCWVCLRPKSDHCDQDYDKEGCCIRLDLAPKPGVTIFHHGDVLIRPVYGTGWLLHTHEADLVLFNGDLETTPDGHPAIQSVFYLAEPLKGWFASQPPFYDWHRQWLFGETSNEAAKLVQMQYDDCKPN